MKLLLAHCFILAIIQLGLLLVIYHYYRSQSSKLKLNMYWMSSLTLSVLALGIFGGGILTTQNVTNE